MIPYAASCTDDAGATVPCTNLLALLDELVCEYTAHDEMAAAAGGVARS
jgi:hypothetical protein